MKKILALLSLLFSINCSSFAQNLIPQSCNISGSTITCGGTSLTAGAGSGTVTSIATTSPITGGTITTTGTIACATCVTSAAALTANSLVIGSGLQASAVTTTGTGVLTALGVNVGSAGAFVTFNGALGTPSSGVATNITGVTLAGHATQATNTVVGNATSGTASPIALTMTSCSTAASALIWTTNTGFGCNTSITANAIAVGGITGLGTNVSTWLATPSSANLASAVTDETGSGLLVFSASPTFTGTIIGAAANWSAQQTVTANITTTATTGNFLATGTVNGNFGVGVKNASNGNVATTGMLMFDDGGNTFAVFTTSSGNSNYAGASSVNLVAGGNFALGLATNNTLRMKIDGGGAWSYVSLTQTSTAQSGTMCYNTSGAITYDATVGCLSSTARIKHDIQYLDTKKLLEKVKMLKPVSFIRNETGIEQIGLIAEDVANIDERLIARDNEGLPRGYSEQGIISLLIGAIKEQQKEIELLKNK